MLLPTYFALSLADVLDDLGLIGLFLLMIGETVFPPIPSEAVLPLAGYLVERGDLAFIPVLLTSTAGSVAGAMVLYEAARRGGRPFALGFLRFARLDPDQLLRAEAWFARHGKIVVLFGRCVPGVRSLISLPAGALRMPRLEYLLFTAIGSAVWNFLLVGAGYLLGTQWEKVSDVIGPISKPLLAVVVLGSVIAFVWWWRRNRRDRPVERPDPDSNGGPTP